MTEHSNIPVPPKGEQDKEANSLIFNAAWWPEEGQDDRA